MWTFASNCCKQHCRVCCASFKQLMNKNVLTGTATYEQAASVNLSLWLTSNFFSQFFSPKMRSEEVEGKVYRCVQVSSSLPACTAMTDVSESTREVSLILMLHQLSTITGSDGEKTKKAKPGIPTLFTSGVSTTILLSISCKRVQSNRNQMMLLCP
jgi:hypothetical protein